MKHGHGRVWFTLDAKTPSPQPSPAQARLGELATLDCPHPQADADGERE
jgi:hypothetical protein